MFNICLSSPQRQPKISKWQGTFLALEGLTQKILLRLIDVERHKY